MAHRNAELLALQGNCKTDPESYRGDFNLQLRHFQALFDLFALKPNQQSKELGDLVMFLAHVCKCYEEDLKGLPKQLCDLLDTHGPVLHPTLRTQLTQALILMRHKNFVQPQELLPMCFRLFKCQDKALRVMVHSFIINDIKTFNEKGCNERVNRTLQNYLYTLVNADSEMVAKRSLAVLTELWRRHIWRDIRTVNVIAEATRHKSPVIMLAALKFFLGQDVKGEEEDDEDEDDAPAAPTKDDIYKAYKKGTPSTKKKKQRKLKRVMDGIARIKKRGQASQSESFAAMQLLHDPQSFAERLLSRCQQGHIRFETRLVMLQVISRVIGIHELIIENFYPFIQRYLQPSQRDVTVVLACIVQACHKLVPPDVLQPVLKQLVDQFVHDKARPEVMSFGLKGVREMCVRSPLIMNQDLLSDLVMYKKFKDKHVSNAAKSLLALFRELTPSMLEKKERGRGADMSLQLGQYGASDAKDRVEGAQLLQEALERGEDSEDDDDVASDDEDQEGDADDDDDEEEVAEDDDKVPASRRGVEAADQGNDDDEGSDDEDMDDDDEDDEDEEGREDAADSGEDVELEEGSEDGGEDEDDGDDSDEEADDDMEVEEEASPPRKRKLSVARTGKRQAAKADSVAQLKRKLAEAKAKKAADESAQPSDSDAATTTSTQAPLEWDRILTQEDFERIRKLKIKKMVEAELAKHGLKSASQRHKLKERLFEEMEELVDEQEEAKFASQRRVDPTSLLGKRRGKAEKAERMASVLAGREGREEFGSSIARKKHKSGGLSNREHQKRKLVLLGAAKKQMANRKLKQKHKNNPKNFRGRASRGAWDK